MYQNECIWFIDPMAMQRVRVLMNAEPPKAGAVDDAERSGLPVERLNNVALVRIHGPMVKNDGALARWFGFTASTSVRRAIESALTDDGVDTIVLDIDSPGGSVGGLPELADTVARAAAQKTVIAQVNGMTASAALWAAAGASKIYAGRLDMIGSIGVRMTLVDSSQYYKDLGIKVIPVDTGQHKSAGQEGTEITEEQLEHFKHIVDGYFSEFLNAVARGRGMSLEKLKTIADGRMFFGYEAHALGLIDGIQGIEQTLAGLIKPAGRSTATARARLQLSE